MSADRKERRTHPRAHLAAQVEVVLEGRSFLAVVRNLSAGGMLIYTANPAPVGSRLDLTFALPEDGQTIRAQALVRHIISGSSMGVQLEKLSPSDAAAIREFVVKSYKGHTKE
jgi:c-di-GMP-binding flagellar brake protein YcgR